MRFNILFLALAIFFISLSRCYSYRMGDVDVKLIGSVNEAYDDNINYVKNGSKDDFRTDLSLRLAADYAGRNISFGFFGNVTRHIFNKNSSFNNTSEDLAFNLEKELSMRDRMSLGDNFLHAEDPRSFEDKFGRSENRYSYRRNTFSGKYTKDITKQFSTILNYTNEIYSYSRSDLADSYLNVGGVEAGYSLNSKTVLLGIFEYIHRKFEHSSSAKTSRAAGGLTQYLTKQFYLNLKGGKDYIKSFNKQNSTAQFISASLGNEIDENTSLKFSYMKENTTNAYSQDIFKSQQVSFSYTRQLLERLRMSLSGFFGKGEYSSSAIRDKLKGVDVGFSYDILPKIKLNLSYNYSNTTSNVSTREYAKNTVLLGLNYEF